MFIFSNIKLLLELWQVINILPLSWLIKAINYDNLSIQMKVFLRFSRCLDGGPRRFWRIRKYKGYSVVQNNTLTQTRWQLCKYCIKLLMGQFFKRLLVYQLQRKRGTFWKKCLRVSIELNKFFFKLYEVSYRTGGWRTLKMYLVTLLGCKW